MKSSCFIPQGIESFYFSEDVPGRLLLRLKSHLVIARSKLLHLSYGISCRLTYVILVIYPRLNLN